ncbi:MAG: hypothetical protein HY720_14660 [Planctomycetes bacterium]|nr:hypothetical protein [Planctomycetota bacterium]
MLAVATGRFRPDLSFEARLEELAQFGFNRFEIPIGRAVEPPRPGRDFFRGKGWSVSNAVVVPGDGPGLADPGKDGRELAIATAGGAARWALARGTRLVVIDPGELPTPADASARGKIAEDGVARLCRSLHALARAEPDALWCIPTPSGPAGMPLASELAWIFEDLSPERIRYWHRTGAAGRLARLGLCEVEAWLAHIDARAAGVLLDDLSGESTGLLPGMGEADFRALARALPPAAERVLPAVVDLGPIEVRAAMDVLETAGILVS